MHRLINFSLFAIFLLALSCEQPELDATITDGRFPLNDFVQGEIKKIEGENLKIEKTIHQNGHVETTIQSNDGWIDMLKYIGKSDFNKPSSSGLFLIDSILTGNSKTKIFTASKEKISPKKVEIKYINDSVIEINYQIVEKNLLFETSESRSYFVDSLIVIERNQSVRFLSDSKTKIETKLLSELSQ